MSGRYPPRGYGRDGRGRDNDAYDPRAYPGHGYTSYGSQYDPYYNYQQYQNWQNAYPPAPQSYGNGYTRADGRDSSRGSYGWNGDIPPPPPPDDIPPPPPPRDYIPPPPPGPPPPLGPSVSSYSNRPQRNEQGASDTYTFRGAAGFDRYRQTRGEDEFSFRAPGPSAPQFPGEQQNQSLSLPNRSRPDQDSHPPPAPRDQHPFRGRGGGQRGARGGGRGRGAQHVPRGRGANHTAGGRQWRYEPPPHERRILFATKRIPTPEQLEGMNNERHTRFRGIPDSSDEEDEDEEDGEAGQPTKRLKAEDTTTAQDTAPKWSNPEYFTVLPPPTQYDRPKKDIVQLIRKAKVESASHSDPGRAVAQNDDFIAFESDKDDQEEGEVDSDYDGKGEVSPAYGRKGEVQSSSERNGEDANDSDVSMDISFGSSVKSKTSLVSSRTRAKQSGSNQPQPEIDDGVGPPPQPPYGLIMPTDAELAVKDSAVAPGVRAPKRKRGGKAPALGTVVPLWEMDRKEDSTPWCVRESRYTRDSMLHLHDEIVDFFEFVRPHEYEEILREKLIQRIQQAVNSCHKPGTRGAQIHCFGSFAAGLYLPTADMDLVAVTKGFLNNGVKTIGQDSRSIRSFGYHLASIGIANNMIPIAKARVPIVKFVDAVTGIKVDISFENDSGLKANETFQRWKKEYPAMPVLVILIKQMLAIRDLNEVFNGGLGGFSIICLVVHMLDQMSQKMSSQEFGEKNYGHLLLHFLDLYGNFNVAGIGLRMNPPAYFKKARHHKVFSDNNRRLTILDPNNADNDISGGTANIIEIQKVFRDAHNDLGMLMEYSSDGKLLADSFLECVVGGDYTSFIALRQKLKFIHEKGVVPANPPQQQQHLSKKQQAMAQQRDNSRFVDRVNNLNVPPDTGGQGRPSKRGKTGEPRSHGNNQGNDGLQAGAAKKKNRGWGRNKKK